MTWMCASLIEGLGKLYGVKVRAAVVKKVDDDEVAAMRQDPDFQQRARCELWYALDSASLETIDLTSLAQKLGCGWGGVSG